MAKEVARIAVDEKAIKLLMTMLRIDYYSAMLNTAEIHERKEASFVGWVGSAPPSIASISDPRLHNYDIVIDQL